jgi:opacity protein-like surface antigen
MFKTLLSNGLDIFIFILLFSSQVSFSQSSFTLGVKGGVNFNENIISGESIANHSTGFNRIGFDIGITSSLHISKDFMLIADVIYIARSMNYDLSWNTGGVRKSIADFISVDILPAVKFNNKFASLYIFLGPRLETLINYDNSILINGIADFKPDINTNTFGFVGGIGLEKKVTDNSVINCELRYGRDLTYTAKTPPFVSNDDREYYKNSSLEFLIGISFNLGKNKN